MMYTNTDMKSTIFSIKFALLEMFIHIQQYYLLTEETNFGYMMRLINFTSCK